MRLSPRAKTQLGLALLFMLLGFGNIIFGHSKSEYYLGLLQKEGQAAESTLDSSDEVEPQESTPFVDVQSLMFPEVSTDKRSRYVRRVTSRLEYYRVAVLGGKIFLALSGVFLLSLLITLSIEERRSDETPKVLRDS